MSTAQPLVVITSNLLASQTNEKELRYGRTQVENVAKTFLVAVLVIGSYSDSLSSVLAEGGAIEATSAYCQNFPESGGAYGVSCGEVDACILQDSQCIPRATTGAVSLLTHVQYGLPGLAPFFLSKIFRGRKPKKTDTDDDASERAPTGETLVRRVRFAPPAAEHSAGAADLPEPEPAVSPAAQSAAGSREPRWAEEWSEEHGRPYWVDAASGESTWIDPMPTEAAATAAAAAAAAAPATVADDVEWEEEYSEEHSRTYWRNVATRETTWERPQAFAHEASTQVRTI